MKIDVKLVKELRERTQAGILDAKKALEATEGSIEKAIQFLREKGAIKAAKKASRLASEGQTHIIVKENEAVMFELNCETDFVAMNSKFKTLTNEIAKILINRSFEVTDNVTHLDYNEKTIKAMILDAIATIGEKISLTRVIKIMKQPEQHFGVYTHSNGKISSVVVLEGGSTEVAKNISMHVAAMNPEFLDIDDVDQERVEGIKKSIAKELESLNKPENIKAKIADGKLKNNLAEFTLLNQTFVMEKMTVAKYLEKNQAEIIAYYRFAVGEKTD